MRFASGRRRLGPRGRLPTFRGLQASLYHPQRGPTTSLSAATHVQTGQRLIAADAYLDTTPPTARIPIAWSGFFSADRAFGSIAHSFWERRDACLRFGRRRLDCLDRRAPGLPVKERRPARQDTLP